jgi:uncharacterized protein
MTTTVEGADRSSLSRSQLLGRSSTAAILFIFLAFLTTWIRFRSLRPLFIAHASPLTQGLVGLGMGLILGSAAVLLFLYGRIFAEGREQARRVLDTAGLQRKDLVVMSVLAGVSEELFFRATLQPLIGLLGATALFTVIHYWVPLKSPARVLYAAFVVVAGIALGVLFTRFGLSAAILGHSTTDLVILLIGYSRLSRINHH